MTQVDKVIEIIGGKSKSRKQGLQTPSLVSDMGGMFVPNPVEVIVGGATIFVTDVERFEKF